MAVQLSLPLDYAPESVRSHGLRAAHPRPLVSPGKRPGRPFASWRTSPAKAWRYPEIELARAGSSIAALVIDCDEPEEVAKGIGDLPDPNWIVRRVANDHAHFAWTLATPVHRYPGARPEPLRLLARVTEFYTHRLFGDLFYTGVLTHNPAPRLRQSDFVTTWGRNDPYSLDDLASIIPFGWQAPRIRASATGRNCDLFQAGMAWAGREANANLPVLPALMIANQEFNIPLPLSEIAATARSVEKYRERWAARGWHCPRWIARQAARGRKGGQASGRARRPGSNEERRPWEAEGVSRRTWYRRRARERGTGSYTDKRA